MGGQIFACPIRCDALIVKPIIQSASLFLVGHFAEFVALCYIVHHVPSRFKVSEFMEERQGENVEHRTGRKPSNKVFRKRAGFFVHHGDGIHDFFIVHRFKIRAEFNRVFLIKSPNKCGQGIGHRGEVVTNLGHHQASLTF